MYSTPLIFLLPQFNKMISYNSLKYNELPKKILKIVQDNNIDTSDSEADIPCNVIEFFTSYVQECFVTSEHFLNTNCPKCSKPHLIPFLPTYTRHIKFKINNILIDVNVIVSRVICENCKSTHALLPDFCIPLMRYSKDAVLDIAKMASKFGTEETASILNIDSKQVRRFVNMVKSTVPNIKMLKFMIDLQVNMLEYTLAQLYLLIDNLPNNITEIYFKHFKIIFLYHKNKRNLYLQYEKLSI